MKNDTFDVVVCGGGVSGSVAAVAAARSGARTLLLEKHAFLGGSLTAMGVGPMMTFHNPAGEQVVRGVAQEVVDRLIAMGASPGHIEDTTTYCSHVTPFDSEGMKQVLEDMVLDAGGTLLYHTHLADVRVENARIEELVVCNKAGLSRIGATIFIDSTGDADLASRAGVPFQKGRQVDNAMQPMTMNLKLANVDTARIRQYVRENPGDFRFEHGTEEGLRRLERTSRISLAGYLGALEEAKRRGEVNVPRDHVLFFETATPGVVIVNTSRIQGKDPTNPYDLTLAEVEGRRQNNQIFALLKARCPGFENAIRCDSAAQVGVRESRHVQGLYTVTAEDLLEQREFPDAICRGAYPIDIHSPDSDHVRTVQIPRNGSYSIPYRSMVVEHPQNLVVVGRCISATSEAFGALRVTPIAMAIGHAGGAAAALCVREKCDPGQLDPAILRETLRLQGAHLL
jgi:hypothetical protein